MRGRLLPLVVLAAAVVPLASGGGGPEQTAGQIAYERGNRIWLMNADGTAQHRTRLVPETGSLWSHNDQPVWSHDGRRVVFATFGPRRARIFIANREGNQPRTLATLPWPDPHLEAAWSPDDTALVLALGHDVDFVNLWLVRNNATPRLLNRPGHGRRHFWAAGPRWSLDGKAILVGWFGYDLNGLAWIDARDGTQHRIPNSTHTEVGPPWYWEWSRDGRRIFYLDGNRSLTVVRRDGTGRRKLSGGLKVIESDLSPDGSRIVFAGGDGRHRFVYIVSTRGGKPKRLRECVYPTWSSDGREIAVVCFRDSQPRIVTLRNDGSPLRNISNAGARADASPRWIRSPSPHR